jgi:hypothetical protein
MSVIVRRATFWPEDPGNAVFFDGKRRGLGRLERRAAAPRLKRLRLRYRGCARAAPADELTFAAHAPSVTATSG